MENFVHNTIKSPPDPRDWKFQNYITFAGTVPHTLDMRSLLPPVKNQGSRGTCASFAASAIKEYQERVDTDYRDEMSPEFIYFYREGKPNAGMYGRDVMKILQKQGSVPEYIYPYQKEDNIAKEPSTETSNTAKNYCINNYALVETVDELKLALNQSGVCYISFPVYKRRPEFWRSEKDEKVTGGHAVAVVGYTEDSFILRNSWGAEWNKDGHVLFPFSEWGSKWECFAPVDIRGSPKPPDSDCCYKVKKCCQIV
jgi:C1A family cysteine protease